MPWFGDNYIGPALPETKLVDDGTGKKVPMNYPYKISVKKEGVPRQPSPELVEQARKWYGGDLYVPSSWSPHMTASDGYEQTPSSMPPPKVEVQGQPAPIKVDGPPQQQPPPYVEKPKPMEVGRLEEMMAAKEAANKIMGASHTNPVVMGGGPTINGKQPSLPPQWAKTPGLGPKTTQPIDHEAVNQSLADDFEKFRIKTHGLMNAPVWQTPVVGPDTPSSMLPRPVNPAEGYNRALQAFAAMRGLGEKQVSADTARGELGQKEVSNRLAEKNLTELEPNKILAGLAGEEMKGKYGLQQAEIQRKTVSQQGDNEAWRLAVEQGRDPIKELEQRQNLQRAMRGDDPTPENYGYTDQINRKIGNLGPMRPIQVTGPGGAVAPVGNSSETTGKLTAAKAMDNLKKAADARLGKMTPQEFLQKTGLAGDKGVATGKYNLDSILKVMMESPDGFDDDALKAAAGYIHKSDAGGRNKVLEDLTRRYMYHSRAGGKPEGAGRLKISSKRRDEFSIPKISDYSLTDETGQTVITGNEAPGFSWTKAQTNPIWETLWGKDNEVKKAVALEKLLRQFYNYQPEIIPGMPTKK